MSIDRFARPDEEWTSLLSQAARDLGGLGLIDPAHGATRPTPGVYSPEELVDVMDGWFRERRQQRGGAAADPVYAPQDGSYAERRHAVLERFEGNREGVYRDVVGLRTVGVGFNMDQPGAARLWAQAGLSPEQFDAVREGRARMTQPQVRQLTDFMASNFDREISRRFPGVDMTENQRIALTTLAYGGLSLLGPRLTEAVKAGDWRAAAEEVLYNSGTARIPGLASRRYREASMMLGEMDASRVLPSFAEYRANPGRRPSPQVAATQ